MKKLYFTPGPSQIYPQLERYMKEALKKNIPSISHRSEEFMQIVKDVDSGLRTLLTIPQTHHIFFLSSSLESMERIIDNIVKKTSFHFVNGSFAQAFADTAKAKGKKMFLHNFLPGKKISFETIIIPNEVELICITQNETSNGTCVPLEDIYLLKKRYPTIPIALDIVSSAPYPNVDLGKIDCAFFSVQKGFGLPAGLGILIVSDILVKNSKKKGYHDFPSLLSKSMKFQTPETPNVLNIFLLKKVVEDMNKKGIETIRKETEEKAKLIEENGNLFIENDAVRSKTVLVLNTQRKTKEIVQKLKKKNIIVGKGYGNYKDTHIRIANFPQHTKKQIKKLLHALNT
ncbi:MAG: aminotransferase class V-fold PLP-dependent enzyme [bacterium]